SVGVDRCLAEHREQIDALRGLASSVEILAVHVDAIGAAVDLRDAEVDEVEEPLIDPGLPHVALEAEERTVRLRGDVLVAEALRHGFLLGQYVEPQRSARKLRGSTLQPPGWTSRQAAKPDSRAGRTRRRTRRTAGAPDDLTYAGRWRGAART